MGMGWPCEGMGIGWPDGWLEADELPEAEGLDWLDLLLLGFWQFLHC